MRHIEKEITKLVYDEFGDELDRKDEKIEAQAHEIKTKDKELKTKDKELETKDKELETKDNEISELTKSNGEYKKKLEQLSQLGDYNCPEAKKIINDLILL